MTPRERSGPHAGPRPRASRRRRPGQKRRIAVDSPTPVKVRRARRPLVTFPILLGTLLPGQSDRPRGMPRADDAVLKGPLSRPLFSGRIIRMAGIALSTRVDISSEATGNVIRTISESARIGINNVSSIVFKYHSKIYASS